MSSEGSHILTYFGKSHASYLHARGKAATTAMVSMLDCRENEDILEIGFGTGATLARLAKHYPNTRFYGAEASALMLKKANARLRFCGLEKGIKLELMQNSDQLPFAGQSFDKVYAESVLGIQEGDSLKNLLLEIKRVLKPGGSLLMNETIWLESLSLEEIKEINNRCKYSFGIIHANDTYPYLADWKKLLEKTGLYILYLKSIDEAIAETKTLFKKRLRSDIFTLAGKIKTVFNPSLAKQKKAFQHSMQSILPPGRQVMDGYFIKAEKG